MVQARPVQDPLCTTEPSPSMTPTARYIKARPIGKGSYGEAFLAHDVVTMERVVVKEMDTRKMSTKERFDVYREADLLAKLRHPNIVQYREAYMSGTSFCIVMDFADRGDLSYQLKRRGTRQFSEKMIWDILIQLLLGIRYLHANKVIHRDIKSANILITEDKLMAARGASVGRIMLADFGVSKGLDNTGEKAMTLIGSPFYLSPEIVTGMPYDAKSDMWSIGVLAYELTTHTMPFKGNNLHAIALNIAKGVYQPIQAPYSGELKSLIYSLLSIDVARRPSAVEVLRLPHVSSKLGRFLSGEQLAKELKACGIAEHIPPPCRRSEAAVESMEAMTPSQHDGVRTPEATLRITTPPKMHRRSSSENDPGLNLDGDGSSSGQSHANPNVLTSEKEYDSIVSDMYVTRLRQMRTVLTDCLGEEKFERYTEQISRRDTPCADYELTTSIVRQTLASESPRIIHLMREYIIYYSHFQIIMSL